MPSSHPAPWTKRALDLLICAPVLLMTTPIMLMVALLIRVRMGAPIFFRQRRPGWHGRPFTLLKFRTMRDTNAADGCPEPDESRMLPLGARLRSLSLDELPQLFNVLRGEMSLVGPRPLLMEYLEIYTPEQARRHEVRPGITGWAQVHGRNSTTWEDRLTQDVWYVEHQSLALDFRILVMTLSILLKREGVNAPGHATMPKFTGRKVP